MQWIRATGAYLVGQLTIFVVIDWIFRAGWRALAGPFLTFAASILTTLFFSWFLNSCYDIKARPRQFAFGAGLSFAFLVSSIDCAWAYLGLALGLLSQQFVSDWTNWTFIVLPLAVVGSVVVYQGAYRNSQTYLAERHRNAVRADVSA
jgi:hypothetical protein